MKNVLLTYVQGDNFLDNIDCEIFLNSLTKFKTFEKICFVNNISKVKIDWLKKYFTIVVEPTHKINVPNCDRFICYYEWLVKNPNYEYVLHLDFRDMIIQSDPFEWMKKYPNIEMFLVKEGMKITESQCNLFWSINLNRILSMHKHQYQNDFVINAGNVGAKYSAFLNLCLLIFTNTNRPDNNVVFEQPIFNWLYSYFLRNPLVKICDPCVDNFCVIGEGVKYDFVNIKYTNEMFYDTNDQLYCLVHQWDRLEQAETIRTKFKNKLSFVL